MLLSREHRIALPTSKTAFLSIHNKHSLSSVSLQVIPVDLELLADYEYAVALY